MEKGLSRDRNTITAFKGVKRETSGTKQLGDLNSNVCSLTNEWNSPGQVTQPHWVFFFLSIKWESLSFILKFSYNSSLLVMDRWHYMIKWGTEQVKQWTFINSIRCCTPWTILSHLILKTALWDTAYYYPYFSVSKLMQKEAITLKAPHGKWLNWPLKI